MLLSVKSDQRGISQIFIVVLAVIVVGVIGGVGYTVLKKDKVEAPAQSSASKAAASECQKTINDDVFCNFVAHYDLDKTDSKMVITTTGANAGSAIFLRDSDGNSSVTMKSEGQETNMVEIDGTNYFKMPGAASWYKLPQNSPEAQMSVNSSAGVDIENFNKEIADGKTTVKKLGKEACGKLTCFKYEVIDSTTPGDKQIVWIDTKDHRLQRFQFTDKDGSTDAIITYENVTIATPSPVTDYPGAMAQ